MLSFFYKIQKLIFEGKYGHELLAPMAVKIPEGGASEASAE